MPIESLTDWKWLSEELLSGLECLKAGWFLDTKYQTCFLWCLVNVDIKQEPVHSEISREWNFKAFNSPGQKLRAPGKTGNWKLKRTQKRTAETEIPKQLSHSAVLCPCVYIAYYIAMVCIWCTRSHAAGSLWWLSGKFLPRHEVATWSKS